MSFMRHIRRRGTIYICHTGKPYELLYPVRINGHTFVGLHKNFEIIKKILSYMTIYVKYYM